MIEPVVGESEDLGLEVLQPGGVPGQDHVTRLDLG